MITLQPNNALQKSHQCFDGEVHHHSMYADAASRRCLIQASGNIVRIDESS